MEFLVEFLFSNIFFLILFLYGIFRFLSRVNTGEGEGSGPLSRRLGRPGMDHPKTATIHQGRRVLRGDPFEAKWPEPSVKRVEQTGDGAGGYEGTGRSEGYGGYEGIGGFEGSGGYEGIGRSEGHGGYEGLGSFEGYGSREGTGGAEGWAGRTVFPVTEGKADSGRIPRERQSVPAFSRERSPAVLRPAPSSRTAREGMKWALIFDSPRALKPYRFPGRK